MRSLLMVASLALLTACSTTHSGAPMPSALPVSTGSDVTGRWTGTWVGTGLFESPREDEVILELKQVGSSGYGRVVFDGSVAAESVPWNVRREGLAGARVSASIRGSRIVVKHELGGHLFAADLKRVGEDRMIGDVRGAAPGVQLLLTRTRRGEVPQARVMPAPPAQPVQSAQAAQAVQPAPPAQVEPTPEPAKVVTLPPIEESKPAATEPATEPDPVQIAKVIPSEEPQGQETPTERPKIEEFVPAIDMKNVYFDFDSAKLRPDALDALSTNVDWLKTHDDLQVMIEGHCDEAGTPEYNQVLGDRRAESVRATLAASGIEAERMSTISYGKERPVCTDSTEECRKQNRHVEFRIKSR
jgi:peptidoglycan-associated lipoprotein